MSGDRYSNQLTDTQRVKEVLVKCEGDLLAASKMLGVQPRILDNAILHVVDLQITLGVIAELQAKAPAGERDKCIMAATGWIGKEVDRRTSLYRLAAVQETYELATMDVDTDNAALMQVKLNACKELRPRETAGALSDVASFFKQLDEEYRELSPRIKSIRVAIAQVNLAPADSSPVAERMSDAQSDSLEEPAGAAEQQLFPSSTR